LLTSFTVYGVNIDVAVPKLKPNAGLSVVPLDLFGSASLKDFFFPLLACRTQ
jgi:hypothetical protein